MCPVILRQDWANSLSWSVMSACRWGSKLPVAARLTCDHQVGVVAAVLADYCANVQRWPGCAGNVRVLTAVL